MKSVHNITELLEKHRNDRPNNSEFIDNLHKGKDWMYNIITKYKKDKIINISDSKDADGFGSQIIIHKGLECILNFLGNQFVEIESERLGRFSKDETNPEHLKNIVEIMGKDKYIICDLATLRPEDANKHLDELLFIDHHPNKTGFDKKFITVNPQEHNINGAKELSSAMNATLMINMLYDKIEEEYSKNKTNRSGLNKLREQLNYLSIFGLAGSKADMQDDKGLNSVLYDYLRLNGLIEKTDSPFYGHSTKEAAKVWAQSTPFYNFRYEIPQNQAELNKFFAKTNLKPSKNREQIIHKIFNKYRCAFIFSSFHNERHINNKSFDNSVNVKYLETLSENEIKELNQLVKDLVGQELVTINSSNQTNKPEIIPTSPFIPSSFQNFTDNITSMKKRVELAKQYLHNLGFEGEEVPKTQVGLTEKLKSLFIDNITAFGKPESLEFSLSQLKKGQYLSTCQMPFVDVSIAEIANLMTAMSKQDYGPLMLDAIQEVLDDEYTSNISKGKSEITKVFERYALYKYAVYNGMEAMSSDLLSRNKLEVLNRNSNHNSSNNTNTNTNIFYSNLDYLKNAMGESKIDLRKMNGVFAGLACNTNLLPGGDTIFFTGVTYDEIINNEKQEWVKISGRATECPELENAQINRLMAEFDGGGHRTAAACSIPINR
ncbi:MAG: hypothetical protein KC550_05575, partial [Nanoarchaeota archaeon]|nr:hypothetical protein [Nanoarchaeota archaeon]